MDRPNLSSQVNSQVDLLGNPASHQVNQASHLANKADHKVNQASNLVNQVDHHNLDPSQVNLAVHHSKSLHLVHLLQQDLRLGHPNHLRLHPGQLDPLLVQASKDHQLHLLAHLQPHLDLQQHLKGLH